MRMIQLFCSVTNLGKFLVCVLLIQSNLLTCTKVSGQTRNSGEKPNFILIVADDLGYGDLGFTGSSEIKTPNIDELARTGTIFTQGYVSSPVCSPSRAGFITGINQVEFGHDNNLPRKAEPGFDPQYLGLPLSQKTIADHLKPLGYISGLVGKWHLGYEAQFHPLKRGFDEFWGYTGGGHDYFTAKAKGMGYLSPIESNYRTPQALTYLTDDKGDECVDFIKRHKQSPFFLFASFNAPHTPMQAPEEDLKLYAHIKNKKRRTYAAMVHRLDVNVGRIMETVKKEGLQNNTVIVFISGNGGPTDTNASLNAPYRGQKGIVLEGGVHVPFIMKGAEIIPSGYTYTKTVTSLDLVPTFLALAAGDIEIKRSFTGINLMPYITDKIEASPHKELHWRFTISSAIRQGNWKLIRLPDRLPMLYHLPSDISEEKDVSLENLAKTKELLLKLGEWDISLPHPVFVEGSEWKRRQLSLYDKDYQLEQPR